VTTHIRGLCSKAPKDVLDDLSDVLLRRRSVAVRFEASGGVDVARAIRTGAGADLAVLGHEQMRELEVDGSLEAGTLRPLFVSDVVAAVPVGVPPVTVSSEEALRAAIGGASRIAYSTGPSGTALLDLLDRWGLSGAVRPKLVLAEPGVPVGHLLEVGEADLGFQQRSELTGLPGVEVLGPLPGSAGVRSTFSGAVLAGSTHVESAREALDFLGSQEVAEVVLAGGMTLA
jgi:molybdate transport system substrate-binding protein